MDELKNKMNDMELGKASGGRPNPGGWHRKRDRARLHFAESDQNDNVNSMATNVDVTQNSRWEKVAKVKPD